MLHWINQLTYLGLIPEYINGIAALITQTYSGHVTIAPSPSLSDYKNIITDVKPDDALRSMRYTYLLTIQRISHIRSWFGIEREFDRYYLRLKNKLRCNQHLRLDKDIIKYQVEKALIKKECEHPNVSVKLSAPFRLEESENKLATFVEPCDIDFNQFNDAVAKIHENRDQFSYEATF